jgi:hypothetical protein
MSFRERVTETAGMLLVALVIVGGAGSLIYVSQRHVRADQARALESVDRTARAVFDSVATAPPAPSEQAYREALKGHDAELRSFSAQNGRTAFTILMHRTAASGGEKQQHFRRCFAYTVLAAGAPSYHRVDCPEISPGETWKYIG